MGLSKLHSKCPKESFELNKFCKKLLIFVYHFRTFRRENLAFFSEPFARFFKSAFYVSIGSIKGDVFLENFLSFFRAWAKVFWLFLGKFSTGSSKLRFTRLEEQFEEENFSEKKSFFQSFSDTKWSSLGFLSNTSQKRCQNCILHIHRNHSRRRFSLDFFRYFGTLTGKIPLFVKSFSSGLSELVSTCHKKHFEAKIILKKSFLYFFCSDVDRKVFGLLSNVFP